MNFITKLENQMKPDNFCNFCLITNSGFEKNAIMERLKRQQWCFSQTFHPKQDESTKTSFRDPQEFASFKTS
jgi:hypothetical protein